MMQAGGIGSDLGLGGFLAVLAEELQGLGFFVCFAACKGQGRGRGVRGVSLNLRLCGVACKLVKDGNQLCTVSS